MKTTNNFKSFIWDVLMERYGNKEDTIFESEWECFVILHKLIGTSYKDFLQVFPIRKVYDKDNGEWKDYYYSKRALDTMISAGQDTFESIEDILDFFFEVQLENPIVEDIVISALMYMVHSTGRNAFDVVDEALTPDPYNRPKKREVSYLRVVK